MKNLVITLAYIVSNWQKQVFFFTGYRGWLLRMRWKAESRVIQKKLNREHGTNIDCIA